MMQYRSDDVGRVSGQQLLLLTKRDVLMGIAKHPKVKNAVNQLYRPSHGKAAIGDGGTAASIRHTQITGELVGGTDHVQKGHDMIKYLRRLLNDPEVGATDKDLLRELLGDLENAMTFVKGT